MDLFSHSNPQPTFSPLAEKMRPIQLADFVGQKHILDPKLPFFKLLTQGSVPNLIIWGPPGTGKTTFARLISQMTKGLFFSFNATDLGAKKIREIGQEAENKHISTGQKTLIFIDEIHRLNKSQQDMLLPFTEKRAFTLIGATTENPGYEINSALLSRSQVVEFRAHLKEDLNTLLKRTFEKHQLKLESFLNEQTLEVILNKSSGDARRLLNILEPLLQLATNSPDRGLFTEKELENILSGLPQYHDKNGDSHYDLTSAFIKSIRGSDPDAAIYYLARLIKGGEDPIFIARRLVILASEDVGNADPKALPLAMAAVQALELIGLPEGGICLAQLVVYLAASSKSNSSYLAYKKALKEVESTGSLSIPKSLRSSQTHFAKKMGYGKNYQYPHDHKKSYVRQSYLPENLEGTQFYSPNELGYEKHMKKYLEWMREGK